MDRREQPDVPVPAVQQTGAAPVEGTLQSPQQITTYPQGPSSPSGPQASGSQQPGQPAPILVQPGLQPTTGLGVGPRNPLPPPLPAKSEYDRALRGSRPISRPMSPTTEGHYEDASDSRPDSGFAPVQTQPIRRSSVPLGQPPSITRDREGRNENGVYRPVGPQPPTVAPIPRRPFPGTNDWVVSQGERPTASPRAKSVEDRINPTLKHAKEEKVKYERKAMVNGYALNFAIGLQVILGALVTGLSSAISKPGVSIAILGGLSTLVASYLARMRGSREPELSLTRTKDLDHFIRDAESFKMDYGHLTDGSQNNRVEQFRRRFEELLGNADGPIPARGENA